MTCRQWILAQVGKTTLEQRHTLSENKTNGVIQVRVHTWIQVIDAPIDCNCIILATMNSAGSHWYFLLNEYDVTSFGTTMATTLPPLPPPINSNHGTRVLARRRYTPLINGNKDGAPNPASVRSTLDANLAVQPEQNNLRKLARLKNYYLDQFNQMESSYAASDKSETALQLEPRRVGSLLPGYCCLLGIVQPTKVEPSICIHSMRKICLCLCSMWFQCYSAILTCLLVRIVGMPPVLPGW